MQIFRLIERGLHSLMINSPSLACRGNENVGRGEEARGRKENAHKVPPLRERSHNASAPFLSSHNRMSPFYFRSPARSGAIARLALNAGFASGLPHSPPFALPSLPLPPREKKLLDVDVIPMFKNKFVRGFSWVLLRVEGGGGNGKEYTEYGINI